MPKSFLISRRRKLQSGAEGPGSKSSRLDLISLLPDEEKIHGDVKGTRLLVSEHQHRRYNNYLGCSRERIMFSNKADKTDDICSANTSRCFDLHHNKISGDNASNVTANRASHLGSLKMNLSIDLLKVNGGKSNSQEFAFNKHSLSNDSKTLRTLITDTNNNNNKNEENPSINPCGSTAEKTEHCVIEEIFKQVQISASNNNVPRSENGCKIETPISFFNGPLQTPESLLTHAGDETTDHLSQTSSTDRTSTNYLQKLQKNSVKKTEKCYVPFETTNDEKFSVYENNSKAETPSDVLVKENPLSCAEVSESGMTLGQRPNECAFPALFNVRQSMTIPADDVKLNSRSRDDNQESMAPLGSRAISRSMDTPVHITLSGSSPPKPASVSLPLRDVYDTGQSGSDEMLLKELYARDKWLQGRMTRSLAETTITDKEQGRKTVPNASLYIVD